MIETKFVIHEHDASHLHWDLRILHDGVLLSWAVPKVPTREAARLAIMVDDHPASYISFEGIIPAGSYGAGTVDIWDKGNCNIIIFETDNILFELCGQKLQGKFLLKRINKDDNKFFLIAK